MSLRLPVYRVSPGKIDPDAVKRIGADVFGVTGFETEEHEESITASAGSVVIELDRRSGGVWAADRERLWNISARTPALLPDDRVYATAGKLLDRLDVLPRFQDDAHFALAELGVGRTEVAMSTRGRRKNSRLDVQARYGVTVRNPGVDGAPDELPIVGGGAKFALTLGDKGRPLAFRGVWRPAAEPEMVEGLDAREAEELFARSMGDVEYTDVRSYLAYHSAPFGVEQDMLTPVYVVGATIVAGDNRFPSRLVTIPATQFGPHMPDQLPQPPRVRGNGQPARALSVSPAAAVAEPFEAGTSWIGKLGGLTGSQSNAKGFVDGLAADGWKINFNWGDSAAFESDWRANDDDYVDAADFVFYTGHADKNGWMLAAPDDGSLSYTEVGGAPGTPGDLWGRNDLEWAIIAACGPLQDNLLAAGGGNVLSRWDGAFDGLHSLMGYGAVTFDNTAEGGRVVKYARQGTPLIDAWFRTAQEIQPSTNGVSAPNGPNVWVGAMYATTAAANPRSDHLHGHGSVSGDPASPTTLTCMWTTC